jgi:hypothetical protein
MTFGISRVFFFRQENVDGQRNYPSPPACLELWRARARRQLFLTHMTLMNSPSARRRNGALGDRPFNRRPNSRDIGAVSLDRNRLAPGRLYGRDDFRRAVA